MKTLCPGVVVQISGHRLPLNAARLLYSQAIRMQRRKESYIEEKIKRAH